MTQFTCKGVKQINNRISFKYDIHLYHPYLSTFFVSAGVPNGEFPEILIAKCRSRFYCTWFFSEAEDFQSWREWKKSSTKKSCLTFCNQYFWKFPIWNSCAEEKHRAIRMISGYWSVLMPLPGKPWHDGD